MKPRRNSRKKPAIPAGAKLARTSAPPTMNAEQVLALRQLFWHNVMREMLTSLASMSTQESTDQPASSPAEPPPDASSGQLAPAPAVDPSLFDGRLAIVTHAGDRIPIGAIIPLFACGPSSPESRDVSLAVECTVFQIRTPDGHVFTIPIHEVRAFHAMAPEIMERLERSARRRAARRGAEEDAPPFGFAAFTSIARGVPQRPLEPPPSHPME